MRTRPLYLGYGMPDMVDPDALRICYEIERTRADKLQLDLEGAKIALRLALPFVEGSNLTGSTAALDAIRKVLGE